MMKKYVSILVSYVIMFMVFSIHVKADEFPLITNEYTEDGICNEAYRESGQPNATTMPVTRYITFEGNVTPPQQFPWQETINGIEYSGTLTLIAYSYMRKDNITVATYRGVLNYYLTQ